MMPLPVPRSARSLLTLASAVLLLLIVTANLPALLVLSFTPAGPARTRQLLEHITTWTRALTAPAPSPPPGGTGRGRRA